MSNPQRDSRKDSEAELFRLLVENVRDYAIFVVDPQGRVRSWNPGAERLLGYAEAEIVGRSADIFFTPEDIKAGVPQREMQQALEAGRGDDDRWHVRKDGSRFWSGGVMTPLWDDARTLRGFAKLMRDRTEWKRVEEAVRHSEGRFRSLMEQAPFSIQVFAPDGRTLRVNRAWEELWGLTLEQIADYNVLHDPQLETKGIAPYLRRAFAGEPVVIPPVGYDPDETLPDRTRHLDPLRRVSAVAYPLMDDAGRVREVVLVHEDITARHRAEAMLREQHGLTRSIADTATTAIFLMDAEGRTTFMNPAAEAMTGFRFEEIKGLVLHDQVHHHRPDGSPFPMHDCPIGRHTLGRQPLRGHEDVFVRKDGTFFPVRCSASPLLRDGELTGIVLEAQDITDQKRAMEALREADRRKDEFLATLAHELRNPLAPLRNGIQVMKLAGGDGRAVEKSRAMMERQVEQMARLLDDLMDVSRISQGKIALKKTRMLLAQAVGDAIETSRPLIERQGHELALDVPDEPIFVDADGTRLTQVFANLLNNAAKYTEPGGRIRLAVERQGGDVVVAVEDTGVGIPAHMLTRVFDMFSQVDRSLEKAQGGLGIGLSIVKRLVEMHGGTITAESGGHGAGSTFVVRLPVVLSVTADRPDAADGPRAAPAVRRRILVVDDNTDGAGSLADMLTIMGNETQTAHDGLEAVAVAEAFKPDVILLDIGMPRLNGYDACRRIRQQPWGRNIVMVAQTGWGQDDDRRKSQEAGFNFHMVKPVDPAALEKLLAEAKAATG